MNKVNGNVEWKKVFENNPVEKLDTNSESEIATLINKSMGALHKVIADYSSHSNKDCWSPYKWNERTTSGLFATAIAKHVPDSGSVLTEFPGHKKNTAAGGRIDIEWITQDNRNWIIFESKQIRVKIEEKDKNGELKSFVKIKKEIEVSFFDTEKGLVAQSLRDFDKYQGAKRLVNKSRDGYYHVGLFFCPVMLNDSITNENIEEIFKRLKSKIPCTMLDEKGKFGRSSNKDFGKLYSCVYLYRPHEQDVYGLITVAIVFRLPKAV